MHADMPPARRYLTLAGARALDCNGCGDCCDSSRTAGYWTWGALPAGQYGHLSPGGGPLIIPVERAEDAVWGDRAWRASDDSEATATPFRCSALREQPDGRGLCGIHDRERPPVCGEFPVHTRGLDEDVASRGVVHLETSAFPRCTWYRVDAVAADERAVDPWRGSVDSDGHVALSALPPSVLARWGVHPAVAPPPPAAA
ncbi:MAG: hypothetical protein WD734_00590 [Dehalococcoidia bacterium]